MMRCRTQTPFFIHSCVRRKKKKFYSKVELQRGQRAVVCYSKCIAFYLSFFFLWTFFSLTTFSRFFGLTRLYAVFHCTVCSFLFLPLLFLLFIFRGSTAGSRLDRGAENRTSLEARRRTPPKISPSFNLITFRMPHVHIHRWVFSPRCTVVDSSVAIKC